MTYTAEQIEQFSQQFKQSVVETSGMYAEEGTYKHVHFLELNHGQLLLVQFIDLDDSGYDTVRTYQIPSWTLLMKPYMEAYNRDGGDEEYDGIGNWILEEKVIEQVCERL